MFQNMTLVEFGFLWAISFAFYKEYSHKTSRFMMEALL
jgi:hypothetical protein